MAVSNASGSNAIIRPATLADVAALVAIEHAAWPTGLSADTAQVAARIRAFPEGQLLAEIDGTPVGIAWSQRITTAQLDESPATFDRLTDHARFTASHVRDGEIYQLIGVAVTPAGRHARLGRKLVDAVIAYARSLAGVRRIVGFTRPIGFAAHPQLTIDQYAQLKNAAGQPLDPMLSFHLGAGAKLLSLHAGYRPTDAEALGYGALIEYPLAPSAAS